MLLRLTINGWRKTFGYLRTFCADKIREVIYLKEQSKHFTKIHHHREYEICGLSADVVSAQKASIDLSLAIGNLFPGHSVTRAPGVLP